MLQFEKEGNLQFVISSELGEIFQLVHRKWREQSIAIALRVTVFSYEDMLLWSH